MTSTIRNIIDETILQYPYINSLVKKKNKTFYVLNKSRYERISEDEQETIAEFTLAGVIYGSYNESKGYDDFIVPNPPFRVILRRPFTTILKDLDTWLGKYKKYRTNKFRDKLLDNFFNSYSEIEFYDRLISKGMTPELDFRVGSGDNNLDFKINFNFRDIFIELTTRFGRLETERAITEDPSHSITQFVEEGGNLNNDLAERMILEIIQRKISEQFRNIDDKNCIILAINIDYCELDIPLKMREDLLDFHPVNVYGILLYRAGQGEFYENHRYCLKPSEKEFFQNLFDDPSPLERLLSAIH